MKAEKRYEPNIGAFYLKLKYPGYDKKTCHLKQQNFPYSRMETSLRLATCLLRASSLPVWINYPSKYSWKKHPWHH